MMLLPTLAIRFKGMMTLLWLMRKLITRNTIPALSERSVRSPSVEIRPWLLPQRQVLPVFVYPVLLIIIIILAVILFIQTLPSLLLILAVHAHAVSVEHLLLLQVEIIHFPSVLLVIIFFKIFLDVLMRPGYLNLTT